MKTTKINVITNVETEIYNCPVCDQNPVSEVKIKSDDPFKSDKVVHTEITCPYCGLSASLEVWNTLCEKVNNR